MPLSAIALAITLHKDISYSCRESLQPKGFSSDKDYGILSSSKQLSFFDVATIKDKTGYALPTMERNTKQGNIERIAEETKDYPRQVFSTSQYTDAELKVINRIRNFRDMSAMAATLGVIAYSAANTIGEFRPEFLLGTICGGILLCEIAFVRLYDNLSGQYSRRS